MEEISVLAAFIVFFIIAVFSTIFASRRLLSKGISNDVRKEVISRHIKYVLILTLTFVLYAWKIIFNDILGIEESDTLDAISVYIFASQGIFLSLLRLSEPVVWRTFSDKFKQVCCCCCYDKDKANDGGHEETLSTFLATSFNVELVYIILKGITKFTKELKQIELG